MQTIDIAQAIKENSTSVSQNLDSSVLEELMKFNLPSYIKVSDVNNAAAGIALIEKGTLNNPADDISTLITFKTDGYMPQFVIKWDNSFFIDITTKKHADGIK